MNLIKNRGKNDLLWISKVHLGRSSMWPFCRKCTELILTSWRITWRQCCFWSILLNNGHHQSARVIDNSFEWKNVTFYGSKDLSYIFSGGQDPNSMICAPMCTKTASLKSSAPQPSARGDGTVTEWRGKTSTQRRPAMRPNLSTDCSRLRRYCTRNVGECCEIRHWNWFTEKCLHCQYLVTDIRINISLYVCV